MSNLLGADKYIIGDGFMRKCPICEDISMDRDSFCSKGKEKDQERIKIWFDDRLGIPCCRCYQILQYISNSPYNQYSYSYKIKFIFHKYIEGRVQPVRYEKVTMDIIIKNLRKWGILNVEV